ncbi:MAG: hypothetical protein IJ318_03070, partial [Clostridia bacterium]|nr:hypothetical protein [Clostridia bacterium]
ADLITQTFRQGVNGFWWLRSPYAVSGYNAWFVRDSGDVDTSGVCSSYGARPAFQINFAV